MFNEFVVEKYGTRMELYVLRVPLKICLKSGLCLEKDWVCTPVLKGDTPEKKYTITNFDIQCPD